jgi:hypothetical protein
MRVRDTYVCVSLYQDILVNFVISLLMSLSYAGGGYEAGSTRDPRCARLQGKSRVSAMDVHGLGGS